jgi:(1->4)-alpha-D-glucan 1-alpha-D-glucosylmutase
MALPVLSTYRLQMRGDQFTFADAENLLDYLDDLGVSHLYLSPILTAAEGSTHGYDVTDPTTVSAALGGPEGLARLSSAARVRGMGLVVDIVPNHVGVEHPEQNKWWFDVLVHGRESAFASFFDIDWALDPEGRIVLPILGSDDDPVPSGYPQDGHYEAIGWRHNVCGYRRFFSITSLAGLRQEDRAVFDATHVEVKRWFDEGLVDGLRIDHPDGLSDPAGYLEWLREISGPDAWIVIEKILAADEALEPTLPVAGTTGYDALREIGGLFVDPAGREALDALVDSAWGDHAHVVPGTDAARTAQQKEIAAQSTLSSELNRLRRAVVVTAGVDDPLLPDAIALLLTNIHVYRCDYPSLSAMMSTALAETASARPELAAPLELLTVALEHSEPAARLQQLCGAVTAKAVEDCLFYRDPTLVSLNEVGGEPSRFGVSAAEFHHSAAVRSRHWPATMTTLSTHDTKRGEDVRARIGVLSQVPSLWAQLVAQWNRINPAPDPQTGLFLLQNVYGVWPADGAVSEDLRHRLHAYAEKAIREAAVHTTWNDPDDRFESAVHAWLDAVIDGPVAVELTALVARLDAHGHGDALGQKLIQLTAPGIPDVYQGTELWDDSLVDPDNRRPVDYDVHREALRAMTHPKIRVVAAALRLRRERPDTFTSGGYRPVLADGPAREHVVAFLRGDDVLVAVSRWTARLAETGWGDTSLTLPDGDWTDRLTGLRFVGRVQLADLVADLPVALLEKTRG